MECLLEDVRSALMLGRNTKGELVERPLSPHLQIYRWPISMALSIVHRASGIALGFGTLVFTWWIISIAASPRAFAIAQTVLGSLLGKFILAGWTFALIFHLCTGIRHLFWDAGCGFAVPEYERSGWIAITAAVCGTVLVLVVGSIL
jgi:succinate dehydrogenase / fumarate reductase cytochrome b subunit